MYDWVFSNGKIIPTGENWYTQKKPVPLPLCPPQIPHGMAWDHTRALIVRGWQLTAWAMAHPSIMETSLHTEFGSVKPISESQGGTNP